MAVQYNDVYAPITAEDLARIPEEMKQEPRWLCWGSEKVPVSVSTTLDGTHFGIDVTKPANWGTFEQASAAIGQPAYIKSTDEHFHIVGIGFVVGDGWFCVDLDGGAKHKGKEDVPDHAIQDALQTMETYAERSISGCGYHVFGKCNFSTIEAEHNKPHRGQDGEPVPESYEVEFFTRRKFIAITGRKVSGASGTAADCSEVAKDFYTRYIHQDCKKDEEKRAAERARVAAYIPVNADDATQMFLLNYPEILAASDSSNFKRGGPGVKLGPGEYSWIGAVKAMQEIGIPEDYIIDWCRRGSNFKSEKDVLNVLNKASKSEKTATVASIVEDAKAHGWKCPPEKRTGEYKSSKKTYQWDDEIPAAAETIDHETGEIIKPEWLIVREWQGREIRRIDEPKFAEMFQGEYKVTRINGVFYVNGKEVQDDYILSLIQRKIAVYFKENTGKLTKEVFTTMCNAVYSHQPEPDESKIYCRNGITINVKEDGSFEAVEEDLFTLTRIGADYDSSATCPTFIQYLKDLFYEEDIPAVQEYFGYCLIPCTRAQSGMFIKGKGGEGKSVMRDVTMALFGNAAIQEYVHELGARFTIANLENKLVVVDDDLQTDLLKETSTLKKLITARERFQVERKLKTKYDAYLYARILAIGNTFIGSKFDHSDGFYRRQLLIDVKPKTREEKDDDRFMSDKCIKEISGILNWALEGLARLIKNNYHFTVSERMARTLDNIKHDGDNSLTFIEDDIYIEITKDPRDQTTTADLFTLYAAWCADNGDVPIKRKSFQLRMSERFKDYKTRIRSTEGRLQGFTGIRLTDHADLRLSRITDKERERIIRLP